MAPIHFVVFTLLLLWDFYIPSAGGKVMDYAAIAILAFSLMPRIALGDWRPLGLTGSHFLFLLTLAPLLGLGAIRGGFLAAAAFLIGCAFIFAVFFREDRNHAVLYRQMGALIVLNLAAFYLQYATFQLSGYLVNYHSWIGVEPRVLVGDAIRAGGLYQEPNSFCLVLFMLNAVRLFCPRAGRDYLFPISIVTLILSESLWGIGAAIFLIFCRMHLSERKIRRIPIVVPAAIGMIVSAALFVDWSSVLELVFNQVTINRLVDIANDPSAQQRFTGSGGFAVDLRFFVGHGVSTFEFQDYLGINGFSFYIYSFGLLGILLFLAFVFRTSDGSAVTKVLIVVLAMSTFPLFTFGFWWAWLALLARAHSDELVRTGQWYSVAQPRQGLPA